MQGDGWSSVAIQAWRRVCRIAIGRPGLGCRLFLKRHVLRRRGSIEFYRDDFPASLAAFRRFLWRSALPERIRSEKPVGIVVLPWVGTGVPWYAVALAIGLAQRGREVMLIWDDTSFPDVPGSVELQNRFIRKMLDEVEGHFAWLRLSAEQPQPSSEIDEERLRRLGRQNLTWILRGRIPGESDLALAQECQDSLRSTLGVVRGLLRRVTFDSLIVPGGVYSSSCVFLLAGEEHNVRVATYDSRIGSAAICIGGIAAQQQDIPDAFSQLWRAEASQRYTMVQLAKQEHQLRMEARDLAQFQATPAMGAGGAAEVLLPLNVDFDSAALGRHYLFDDTVDWVTRTTEFVLRRRSGRVVVRQHPSERRQVERSRLAMGAILRERFGEDPRLRFVAAEDPVSTYDLLQSASLVLPFVSTIAMEGAALSKPVLIAGRCYYSELGFVWAAASQGEYFDLLERGLEGRLPLLPDQVEKAWLCYYLTQVCNRVWTSFTPQPPDFWTWVKQHPRVVFGDPAVTDILTSLSQGIPVSLIRHERRMRETTSARR